MDERTKKMLEGLNKAIRAEWDGHHFYKMAAQSTSDEKGRQVFEQLASEEMDHHEFLKKQYRHIVEHGTSDLTLKLGPRSELTEENPFFSENLMRRAKEAHYEMSALSIAIQLELSAKTFYTEQAAQASDDNVKTFFKELAVWETGHYMALMRQQENLMDDYWGGSDFLDA